MMPSRPRRAPATGSALPVLALSVALALGTTACAPAAPPSGPPGGTPAPASGPAVDGPPTALASVEGGDPVAGQLGTYTWDDTGSDAPWLPGSPIRAGVGESLTISVVPATDVASWTARYVALRRDGPDGAIALGAGPPPVRLELPPPGAWTVEVSIVFEDERGTASYAWAVTIG